MAKNEKGTSRLITLSVPDEILKKDLENFGQKALDLGASMAKIIPAEITCQLETLAFSHGYHLATGFSQDSCVKALCGQERCLSVDPEKVPRALPISTVFIH